MDYDKLRQGLKITTCSSMSSSSWDDSTTGRIKFLLMDDSSEAECLIDELVGSYGWLVWGREVFLGLFDAMGYSIYCQPITTT